MEVFFEELNHPVGDRSDGGPETLWPKGERAASLVADGITVARVADSALFDPLATSDEKSRDAYEAALRLRKGLKAPMASKAR